MNAIQLSSQLFQSLKLGKPAAIPQTPLAPALGSRAAAPRVQQANAFSFTMPEPQGPFSFIQPDVPADRKNDAARRRPTTAQPAAPAANEETEQAFGASNAKPRFRSALEQVSYITNESAEKRFK